MANPSTSLSASLPLKEAYNDLVHPTAKAVGETVSIIPRVLNVALNPIRKWVAQKEYNFEQTEQLLAKKLENIPADKIVSPEPYIAVPAVQNLSYCMDSEELRELYANLLANAVISDKKEDVRSAFVQQIQQMNPLDARVLKALSMRGVLPLCSIKQAMSSNHLQAIEPFQHFKSNLEGSKTVLENTGDYPDLCESLEELSVSISNLMRLGLLSVPARRYLVNDNFYLQIDGSVKIQSYLLSHSPFMYLERRLAELTPLGKAFCKICVIAPDD